MLKELHHQNEEVPGSSPGRASPSGTHGSSVAERQRVSSMIVAAGLGFGPNAEGITFTHVQRLFEPLSARELSGFLANAGGSNVATSLGLGGRSLMIDCRQSESRGECRRNYMTPKVPGSNPGRAG